MASAACCNCHRSSVTGACDHLWQFCVFVAGAFLDARNIVWGDWSVESQYVTLGQPAGPTPAAAAAAAPPAGAGKKKNKKVPDKNQEKKMSSAAAQQAALDEQNAIQQLQVRGCCCLIVCT